MEKNKMKLSDINKENPFKVPEGYFDNFYANLKLKLDEVQPEPVVESKKQKVFHLNFNFKHVRAIAASVLIFIFMQTSDVFNLNNNNYSSLEDYLLDTDAYTLYSLFESETTSQEELNDEDIFNYLNSTVSDYELYVELNK